MKDFIIDACSWYVDSNSSASFKKQVAQKFKKRYRPLLTFLKANQLLADNDLDINKINWLNFEIRVTDFSSEGLELVMLCHDKWLSSLDKGCNPDNIKTWERNLSKLREDDYAAIH